MKKILIIEDDLDFLDEIADILRYENFEVIKAANGNDGIKFAGKYKPDLVLCDILMPVIDGFEVLRKLKEYSHLFWAPFIFITALDGKNLQQAIEKGADGYLIKPFSRMELLNKIHSQLK